MRAIFEVTLIVSMDTEESNPPALWPWDDIMELLPGVALHDIGILPLHDLEPQEIN